MMRNRRRAKRTCGNSNPSNPGFEEVQPQSETLFDFFEADIVRRFALLTRGYVSPKPLQGSNHAKKSSDHS